MRNISYKIKKYVGNRSYKGSEQKKKDLDGSYTVEMALLFPVILGVLLFSLGLTFYLYDLCILDIGANLAAMEGQKFADMSEKNIERKVRRLAEEEVKNSLIAMEHLTVSVQVKKDKISVAYNGEYSFPIINLFLGGSSKKEAVSIQAESVIQNAVEWIQTVRKVGRIVDYIKGSAE